MRKRLLINYIITLVLSALITGALAFYFIQTSYFDSKEEKLITNLNLIEGILKENYKDATKVNFYRLAYDLSLKTNSRVTFIDIFGWPLADSINNSIIFEDHSHSLEYRYAIRGERNIVKKYSEEIGKKYFYIAIPPIRVGDREVILRLGDNYDDVDLLVEQFAMYFVVALGMGIVFSIVVSYISVRKIVKPIKELTIASKQIAKGEFDKRINVNTKDEIEELSVSFNQMASRLKATINQLKDANADLDAILSSINDGIIALDENNTITLANQSVSKILGIDVKDIVGKNIGDALRDLEYIEEIEECVNSPDDFYTEIKVKDKDTRYISLSTYPIVKDSSPIGQLLVFRDITSFVNVENMRKNFVANVSHELRTPLTSISGFVETLKIKKLDEETREKVLDIIEFETERLVKLINELLDLSKIESIKDVRNLSKVYIEDDIHDVLKLLEPQINNNKLSIELNIEDKLNPIHGDKELFRRLFMNLVENSIKYNNLGGYIKINISNYENGIMLIVEDSGIGIPEEDLPLIFERFFRVDKSRSNNREGTGLGLAIVKHIVSYFGGSIDVESQMGQGSRFIVKLPN